MADPPEAEAVVNPAGGQAGVGSGVGDAVAVGVAVEVSVGVAVTVADGVAEALPVGFAVGELALPPPGGVPQAASRRDTPTAAVTRTRFTA